MLIDLLFLLLLAWAFLIGYSRGLILQGFYSFGTIVSAIIAFSGYKALAKTLTIWVPFASATQDSHLLFFNDSLLFRADEAFYAGLAFLMIYIATYIIFRLVGLFFNITRLQPLGKNGKIIAGALAVFATYFGLQMAVMLFALIPMTTVQTHLHASFLARLMVNYTPISSGILQNFFIHSIIK